MADVFANLQSYISSLKIVLYELGKSEILLAWIMVDMRKTRLFPLVCLFEGETCNMPAWALKTQRPSHEMLRTPDAIVYAFISSAEEIRRVIVYIRSTLSSSYKFMNSSSHFLRIDDFYINNSHTLIYGIVYMFKTFDLARIAIYACEELAFLKRRDKGNGLRVCVQMNFWERCNPIYHFLYLFSSQDLKIVYGDH
ncbi:uncharacterized protein MELLADRAFT_66148 [Melampsora larici-populina 98AG31]|uniref:Uncharacterized protein n=1 Tax=Melampsora larici-populina (strain 98AG31 / pathotype 3-4-7) TaxID=747676 RepID=F4RY27_MELLP|nr:uncharacterized protein MELLADRAFT_66148 [Melampsora larici-populina 98AG31]EGG02609.1 hypothetical protein MELLADRAFT_66148 [Melampsora larici-populina 98AG31]